MDRYIAALQAALYGLADRTICRGGQVSLERVDCMPQAGHVLYPLLC